MVCVCVFTRGHAQIIIMYRYNTHKQRQVWPGGTIVIVHARGPRVCWVQTVVVVVAVVVIAVAVACRLSTREHTHTHTPTQNRDTKVFIQFWICVPQALSTVRGWMGVVVAAGFSVCVIHV